MNDRIEVTKVLDTSGKCCPMPMVETNKTVKKLIEGNVLQIIATDPGTQLDIPSWCKRTGNELIASNEQDNSFTYYVKKYDATKDVCGGCVYFPANLPHNAYSKEDWIMLQNKSCSFDLFPGDEECKSTRKTSCSLVDLEKIQTQ